jgi:hypothetical protein
MISLHVRAQGLLIAKLGWSHADEGFGRIHVPRMSLTSWILYPFFDCSLFMAALSERPTGLDAGQLTKDKAGLPGGCPESTMDFRGTGVFMPLTFRKNPARSRRRYSNKTSSDARGAAAAVEIGPWCAAGEAGQAPTIAAHLVPNLKFSDHVQAYHFAEDLATHATCQGNSTNEAASACAASLVPITRDVTSLQAAQSTSPAASSAVSPVAKSITDVDALMQQVQLLLANMEANTAAAVAAIAAQAAAAPDKTPHYLHSKCSLRPPPP